MGGILWKQPRVTLAQEHSIQTLRKMSIHIRIPPRLNWHLMSELQCRREVTVQRSTEVQALIDGIRKAKAQLEIKLARVIKKSFQQYISYKRIRML